MKYKNLGRTTRTFYGVQFKPGEVKDVPGYINAPRFSIVEDETNPVDISKQDVTYKKSIAIIPSVEVNTKKPNKKSTNKKSIDEKPISDSSIDIHKQEDLKEIDDKDKSK